jgi:antirestriction protein
MKTTDTPRIYVASLSDYNAGVLHGAWIDANQSPDDIQTEVAAMLRESKHPNVMAEDPDTGEQVPSAEEWAIHDYEGFAGLKISEHQSFEDVSSMAKAIEDHGAAFAAWHNYAPDYNTDEADFQEAYAGEWDSLADYVQDYWDQCDSFDCDKISGNQWWHPANYIDWERMGEDMQRSGDIWTHDADGGKIYVFRTC